MIRPFPYTAPRGRSRLFLAGIATVAGAALFLLARPEPVLAENGCPFGHMPVQESYQQNGNTYQRVICVPGGSEQAAAAGPAAPPPPKFTVDKAFGALAYDSANASWSTGNYYRSEKKAAAGALAHCREVAGSNCSLMLSYSNQCAAVARAVSKGAAVPGSDSANTGTSKEEAEANAVKACRSDWSTNSCTVILSDCSHHSVRQVQ